MKKYLLFTFLIGTLAFAGLPPTSSKVSTDTGNVTTFNYLFPNFTGTHTGTNLSLGVNSISGGGTGATTQQGAINALTGTQTNRYFLRSDGNNSSLSAIQVADVPILNQNTTGNAATVTTNANLTGPVTSVGNATAIADGAIGTTKIAIPSTDILYGDPTGFGGVDSALTFNDVTKYFSTNNMILGAGDGATPSAATLRGPAASGNNVAGADITIQGSNGTGTAGGGNIIFQTAPASPSTVAVVSSTGQVNNNTNSLTFSHDGGSGANRLLVLQIAELYSVSTSSVTYNGTALTRLDFQADGGTTIKSEMWYLVNPPTGINNVVITFSSFTDTVVRAVNVTGVNQTTPFGVLSKTAAAYGTSISLSPASNAGDLILDQMTAYAATPAVTGGQTLISSAATSGLRNMADSYKTGAATSTTVSYSASTNAWTTLMAVAIKPAATGGADTMADVLRLTNAGNVLVPSLAASSVLVSDASKQLASSSVSSTTLGYLDATSSVQTQLNTLTDTNNSNLLTNPSFEKSTYSTGWTITNSTGTVETTQVSRGVQAAKLALSAQTGDLLVQSLTPTQKLQGLNLEASCKVSTTLSTVQVCALQGGIEQQCLSVPSTGNYQYVSINMPGPTSGSIGVKVKATASSTGNIYVDDCYVGTARGVGNLPGGVSLLASYWVSSNFSASTTVPINFDSKEYDDNSVVTTSATAWKYTAKSNGIYLVTPNLYSTSSVSFDVYKNGTIYKPINYSLSSSNSSTGATQVLMNAGDYIDFRPSGAAVVVGGSQSSHNTSNVSIALLNSPSQQVINSNVVPASWSGYHLTSTQWSTTSPTYADATNATGITLIQTTNRNFGTVTTAAGSVEGISLTFPRAGNYRVSARVAGYITSTNQSGAWRLVDGSGTVIDPGIALTTSTNTANLSISLSGIYTATTAATTLKVQMLNLNGSTTYSNGFSPSFPVIQWDIVALDSPLPAPLLTGNITSESTSSKILKSFNVSSACTTGTCAISENDGFNSCTFTSTGVYSCAFTNAYSAKPVCTVGTNNAWGGVSPICQVDQTNTTTSTLTINCFTSGANTLQNSSFSASCIGSK